MYQSIPAASIPLGLLRGICLLNKYRGCGNRLWNHDDDDDDDDGDGDYNGNNNASSVWTWH